jgi:hypothetical protein
VATPDVGGCDGEGEESSSSSDASVYSESDDDIF